LTNCALQASTISSFWIYQNDSILERMTWHTLLQYESGGTNGCITCSAHHMLLTTLAASIRNEERV